MQLVTDAGLGLPTAIKVDLNFNGVDQVCRAISSSSGTAGLPPFISFSTRYPDLNWDVLGHTRI